MQTRIVPQVVLLPDLVKLCPHPSSAEELVVFSYRIPEQKHAKITNHYQHYHTVIKQVSHFALHKHQYEFRTSPDVYTLCSSLIIPAPLGVAGYQKHRFWLKLKEWNEAA